MSTNLTVDDTSLDIVYSDNWSSQSNDASVNEFFQSTYHSAQADGASASFNFTGSAIYLYGSKGPGHANYSVQFDDKIIFLSADAPNTQYRQPLFAFTFSTSGTHFVQLKSVFVGNDGRWVDLDYITITVDDTNSSIPSPGSQSSQNSPTILPPWSTISSSAPQVSSTSPHTPASSSTSATKSDMMPMILSIVFGIILGLVILILMVIFCLRWRRKRGKVKEQHYRTRSSLSGTTRQFDPETYISGDIRSPVSSTSPQPMFGGSHSNSPRTVTDQLPGTAISRTPPPIPPHYHTMQPSYSSLASKEKLSGRMSSTSRLSAAGTSRQRAESPVSYATDFRPVSLAYSVPPTTPPPDSRPGIAQISPSPSVASPKRPKRPQENLLDWFGNTLDVNKAKSKRKRDWDSTRTNFLKV